ACPLAVKVTEPVAKCLFQSFLTFGAPCFLERDAGGEFTLRAVNTVCPWINVKLDHDPAGHPRGQGAVERYEHGILRIGDGFFIEDEKP
ncbi:unnamed protein product, partial [Sphacelaria rigidula]